MPVPEISKEEKLMLIEAERKASIYGLPPSSFLHDRLKSIYYTILFFNKDKQNVKD